ncbi:MAG: WGxxGxxG family protein [Caldimonas sp.]
MCAPRPFHATPLASQGTHMRSKHLHTCALALAAAISTPSFAQTTTGTPGVPTTGATNAATTSDIRRVEDRGMDWGWLGLLGLAGLVGLRRRTDGRGVDTTRSAPQR